MAEGFATRQRLTGSASRGWTGPRPLELGVVEVWFAFSDRPEEEGEASRLLSLLSREERARHDRRHGEPERREFRLAHALLRRALSAYRDLDPREWAFELGAGGRPEVANPLAGPRLRFNLSHTSGLVACVVAVEAPVGIDVESCRRERAIDPVARRSFAPAERRDLEGRSGGDRMRRFLDYWTLKEAHLKALGATASPPPRAVCFSLIGEDRARVSFEAGEAVVSESWHYWRVRPSPDHQLAVAMAWAGTAELRLLGERRP